MRAIKVVNTRRIVSARLENFARGLSSMTECRRHAIQSNSTHQRASGRDAAMMLAREVDKEPAEDGHCLIERTHLPSRAETGLGLAG